MSHETQETVPEPTQAELCERLVQNGNILGLLDLLEDSAKPHAVDSATSLISRCIRQSAQLNLTSLCDDAFARIIGLALLLQSRAAMFITARLSEAERFGAHCESGLPADILDQGWIERAERLGRFIAEMAQLRARVAHINRLNENAERTRQYPHWLEGRSPMDSDPLPPRNGQGMPPNGRLRCPENRIEFP